LLSRMYQHRSRDLIIGILKAADRPLAPKEVYDAQTEEPKMNHNAVRKLMRDMLHGRDTDQIIYQDVQGRYALLSNLVGKPEINDAPQVVLYAQLNRMIRGHRHQRRTQPNDINEVLRRLLRKNEASIHNVDPADIDKIKIKIVLPPKPPQPALPEQPQSRNGEVAEAGNIEK
jgi:hypothetical protein